MADVICPKCGAKGNENCSTVSGRDHIARRRAEIERDELTGVKR